MSLHLSTAAELGRGLRARKFSSVEVTRHFLDRIGRANPELNAFVTVTRSSRSGWTWPSRGCAIGATSPVGAPESCSTNARIEERLFT